MPGCAAPPVGTGTGVVTGEGKIERSSASTFLSHAGGINISRFVDGQRGDFFFRCAVKHEAFAAGLDLVYQSTAVRAGDQIALGIHRQHADVGFIAFEENGMLALGSDAKDFAMIAGGHVEVAGIVENQVPYVFRARIEIDRGGESLAGLDRWVSAFPFAAAGAGQMLNAIHLAVGIGGGIENAVLVHRQRLYLQLLGLEDGGGLSLRGDAIHARGRAGRGIKISALVSRDRPDVG